VSPASQVVLDASAVLAWVLRENGGNTVDKLLPVAVIPAPALVETLYRAREKGHRLPADELHAAIVGMGARIEAFIEEDVDRAAELIAASRAAAGGTSSSSLSLGDGLCLAVAERLNLTVTGGDQHWATCDLTVEFMPFR
jgi:ribonuclease VapC